ERGSEVGQLPSPPPSAGGSRRYAYALPQPTAQTRFAPTPPASARRDADLTLSPMLYAPPGPQLQPHRPYQHHGEPTPARKRRRVTISEIPITSSPLQNTTTPLTLPPLTPTALAGSPARTQTLAHRRGKASSKLTIHTPNSISSVQGANVRLATSDIKPTIRSAPPDIARFNFNPAYIKLPQPAQVPHVRPPLKEPSASVQRIQTDVTTATTAASAPSTIVPPGQLLVLNAPAPPSLYITTLTQFPPHTSHSQSPRAATKSESTPSKWGQSSGPTPGTSRTVIHSAMTPSDIAGVLERHGCENLTYKLDQSTCSAFALCNGGLGDIYLGRLDGIEVAIKTTRLHIVNQDKKHLKHAAKELHTWSKCEHPNVLGLLGFVEFRGQIGMVSKWIGNGNVQTYLKERPDTDRCEMANVLIADNGAPMLSDFGNSVLRDQSLQLTRTTVQTNVSPRWTAPEILEGSTSYSYAADVYALGMTFLEVITGNVPFHKLQREQAIYAAILVRNETPERPEMHIPVDSRDGDALWSLLKKCWATEPGDRPSAVDAQTQIKHITREGLRDLSRRMDSEKETNEGEMSSDDEEKSPSELEHS
ncbi:hypothetical protein FRC11_013517, partial [Ceratobasidium sp. 423]